jgi:catechol 2,3-dioxygenase-like lactoylglutathione lyase family enzyme
VILDHVVIAVRDLDAAAATFESILGWPAAVRSEHPRGTHNVLFLFPRGPYLELLAPWDAPVQGTSAGAVRRFLDERGEGLFGLALAPDDITAEVARLRALGFDTPDAVANSGRNLDGRVREWRGTVIPETARDHSFMVEHFGWDWRAELHAPPLPARTGSAVTGIHHATFDLDDADAASRAWNARFGLPRTEAILTERMGARVNVHQAGEATIEFVSPTRPDGPVAQRIAHRGRGLSSLAFDVSDIESSVRDVRAAGVTVGNPEPGVLPRSRVARIAAGSAHNVAAQLLQFDSTAAS